MDAIIHSIHSGNNDKNYIAYTDGINVQIYDTQSSKIKQQFTNMKNEITSVALRKDAGLVALGNINGYIQVYDIKRKLQLRSFKNHQKAVHALHFTNQESNLYSGSDDLNIRLFDVAGGNIVRTIGNAHQDFIRSIHTLPNNHNNLLSSSYDFKINLFDFNAEGDKPKMVFDHGHPVEDIAVLPSGFQFISVGGTQTNIWDIRTGKILESLNNNQKTVTCVQYLSTGDRFITGAQDNHVKIYRTDTFTVTHQYKMPSPVVALDFTQDTKHFAVGMSDGQLVIKKNSKKLGDQERRNL
ncbi:WD40-repeat-containing domain [Pseudocohnilembus persalinus]|uniref:WD40-repeat-containing domain n=1 Tax=Pseudocohnilembus persalinus TaxID=266149 RepID=A0A0V0R6L8_PSEPJ|nr:WD40-repeat-containing domain [Pseudocohnilembus persalinus]|eukprot:KRX10000.1 WD40-repeat-containing domain [Pseudocohnilembus persalinus]